MTFKQGPEGQPR